MTSPAPLGARSVHRMRCTEGITSPQPRREAQKGAAMALNVVRAIPRLWNGRVGNARNDAMLTAVLGGGSPADLARGVLDPHVVANAAAQGLSLVSVTYNGAVCVYRTADGRRVQQDGVGRFVDCTY